MHLALSRWFRSKRGGANLLFQLLLRLSNGWEVWREVKATKPVTKLALRRGPIISARPEDQAVSLFWEIFVDHCYTRRNFYLPRFGDTIVDLGANIGVFSLHCQHIAPGVRIHAVEPNPSAFAQLQKNLAHNNLGSSVATYSIAVSDRSGVLYLKPGVAISGHQELVASGDGKPIPCVKLEDFFALAKIDRCDLLKIDTEGGELAIIEGASRNIWSRIRNIVIEYHDNVNPGSGLRLHRYLTELGFATQIKPTPGFPHLGTIYARRR
jgi:FkbM family methyltransferase